MPKRLNDKTKKNLLDLDYTKIAFMFNFEDSLKRIPKEIKKLKL